MYIYIFFCVVISHATSCQRNLNYYYRGGKRACVKYHSYLLTKPQVPKKRFKCDGWPKNTIWYLAVFGWLVVSNIFYFHPYLGKISILTHIFQMGWFNHHLVGESLCGLPRIVLFFGEPPPFFKLCCDQARLYTSLFYEADPFKASGWPKRKAWNTSKHVFSGRAVKLRGCLVGTWSSICEVTFHVPERGCWVSHWH